MGMPWDASYLNPSKKSSENHKKFKKHRQVFLGITEDED
jgi:hypothetical protein